MNEEIIELLESVTDEELDEDEAQAISKALDTEDIAELEDALKVFEEKKEDFDEDVIEAIATLAAKVKDLAVKLEEKPKEEGEKGEKKVEKSRSWSFTLGERRED